MSIEFVVSQGDISALSATTEELTNNQTEVSEAYSVLQERLENVQSTLKDIEEDQIGVSERPFRLKKDDINARQKANVYVNRLHTIKRYMEKRNLPGIPRKFLKLLFDASHSTEDLMAELEQAKSEYRIC